MNTLAPFKMAQAFRGHLAKSEQRKLVTISSGMGSVELAEVSARATRFQGAAELDTLAAAYARAARFSAAVRMGERAVDRARRGGDEALAAEIETRVTLYRRGQPYTDSVESAGRDPRRGASFRREQRLY